MALGRYRPPRPPARLPGGQSVDARHISRSAGFISLAGAIVLGPRPMSRGSSLGSSLDDESNRDFAMKTVLLLVGSNLFMTYAWYGHLRTLRSAPWYVAVLASWGVAFFEYALQVPANRIGYARFSLGQLKITQEMITLSIFVPFSIVYMKEAPKLDYLWAGLCIVGAAYFIFRSR
jgi:uncharacterized protein (DUF486 family)